MKFKKLKATRLLCSIVGITFCLYTAAPAQSPTGNTAASPITSAASTPPPQENKTPTEEKYRIGFQDVLEIQVFRHPELTQRVGVNANGTISLFRIDKPVVAVCKTERELADEIAALYEENYLRNPFVNVVAAEQKSQSVAVIGAVEKPGSFYLNRRVHLLELLAFAGGPKTDEVGSRLIIARTGSTLRCTPNGPDMNRPEDITLMDFAIKDIQQGKTTLWMESGDVVSVLDADVVYVYGNVNKQGAVRIKEPITLTQAIVLAEGLKPATKRDKIRILRQRQGTVERDEFVYDLGDIDKRKVEDPILQPNDVVAVSEDKAKSILNSIGKSLTQGIPSVLYRVP